MMPALLPAGFLHGLLDLIPGLVLKTLKHLVLEDFNLQVMDDGLNQPQEFMKIIDLSQMIPSPIDVGRHTLNLAFASEELVCGLDIGASTTNIFQIDSLHNPNGID